MKELPFSLRLIAIPLLVIASLFTVMVIGIRIAFNQIGNVKKSLDVATKTENLLKTKLDVLSNVQNSSVLNAKLVTSALPSENPALMALSQLKSLAQTKMVLLTNNRAGGENKDPITGLQTSDITVNVNGSFQAIFSYLSQVKSLAPLMRITKVEFNMMGASWEAATTVKIYWSPLPTKIPSLIDPVAALNDSEKATLTKINALVLPAFTELTPGTPTYRANIFGE